MQAPLGGDGWCHEHHHRVLISMLEIDPDCSVRPSSPRATGAVKSVKSRVKRRAQNKKGEIQGERCRAEPRGPAAFGRQPQISGRTARRPKEAWVAQGGHGIALRLLSSGQGLHALVAAWGHLPTALPMRSGSHRPSQQGGQGLPAAYAAAAVRQRLRGC
jgi:hypothetical protein